MGANTMPDEHEIKAALAAVERAGSMAAAARELEMSRATLQRWVNKYAPELGITADPGFEVVSRPEPELLSVEELLDRRKRQFDQKRKHEESSKLIPVRIKLPGPIGVLHFGDPHVDDDGTDLATLERHTDLVNSTEGLFGANVGDTTNNWVGRLARLYGEQSTSAAEAWQLAEWFVSRVNWLYMIDGNHDCWSGQGNPLKWMMGRAPGIHKSSEVRLELNFPTGAPVRINARHDFAGHSMWNPAHGQMKAATMGYRDHITISGHKHTTGYGVLKDGATGITCHAIQVASYKVYDRYAKERGFRDQTLSPSCLTIIDPTLHPQHPDLVKVYWDPEEGADVLSFLRRRKA